MPRRYETRSCGVAGCTRAYHARGYCNAHLHRLDRYGDPCAGGPDKTPNGTLMAWLLEHADFGGDECLTWPFARRAGGYGEVKDGSGRVLAHRKMCELAHGPAPSPEHEAAHRCGKGHEGCVNPNHLRWATRAENQADRVLHGTDCRGEKSPHAKLTEDQVLTIRALEGTATRQEIADRFGVTRQNVRMIQRRKSWAWLDGHGAAA